MYRKPLRTTEMTHPGCGVFQFFKIAMPRIPLEDGPWNVLAVGDPSKSDVNVRILNFWLEIDFSAKIEVFFTFLTSFLLSPLKNRYFEKKLLISTYFWSIFKFSRKIGPKFQNRPKISQNGQIFFSKYLFFDGDIENDVEKVKNTYILARKIDF